MSIDSQSELPTTAENGKQPHIPEAALPLQIQEVERENQTLEEQNNASRLSITRRLGNINADPSHRRTLSYLIGTQPNILLAAARGSGEMPLVKRVEALERDRLETEYGISLNEPGEVAEAIANTLTEELDHPTYMSGEESQRMVRTALDKIHIVGSFSPEDIRQIEGMLRIIPVDHLRAAVGTIEKTPVKSVVKILKTLSGELANVTDSEMVQRVNQAQHDLIADKGHALAYIQTAKRRMVIGEELNSEAGWTVAHEVAHGVYRNVLTQEQREEWDEVGEKALSLYGKHAPVEHQRSENFSEMYSLYLLNKPLYYALSLLDDDYKQQYQFFHSFMPNDEVSNLPRLSGITKPLSEKMRNVTYGVIGRLFKAPLQQNVIDNFGAAYSRPTREALQDERAVDAANKRISFLEKVLGKPNPVGSAFLQEGVLLEAEANKFLQQRPTEAPTSRRMYRVLKDAGIYDRLKTELETKTYDGIPILSVANSDIHLAVVSQLIKERDIPALKQHLINSPILLEDRVRIINAGGVITVPYRPEIQAEIDAYIYDNRVDVEDLLPVSYEVQTDGIRALKEPTQADLDGKEAFIHEEQMELKDSDQRAFSAEAIALLQNSLNKLPPSERRRLKGFLRVSNEYKPPLRQLMTKKESLVPLSDDTLTGEDRLVECVLQATGTECMRREEALLKSFIELSGWKKADTAIAQKAILNVLARGVPYGGYRANDMPQETFLTPISQSSLSSDFITCYRWYIQHPEAFAQMTETNPVIKGKYELLQRFFHDKGTAQL